MVSHPRYKVIKANDGSSLSFVIFKDKYRLRAHTVKHILMKPNEWEKGWERILKPDKKLRQEYDKFNDISDVFKVKTRLEEIGCRYETDDLSPVCRNCELYENQCGDSNIVDLENLYVELIGKCLEFAVKEPRYVHFTEYVSESDNERLSVIVSGPVVVRTMLMSKDGYYNVMTAFVRDIFTKLGEAIKIETERIKREARRKGNIDWNTLETWMVANDCSKKISKKHYGNKEKRGNKSNYNRHSNKSYRKWAHDEDEDEYGCTS